MVFSPDIIVAKFQCFSNMVLLWVSKHSAQWLGIASGGFTLHRRTYVYTYNSRFPADFFVLSTHFSCRLLAQSYTFV